MKFNESNVARLCEIATIYGQLLERQIIKEPFDDLDDAFEYFLSIYKKWVSLKNIQNEAEIGYITEYASRVLQEELS